MGNNKGEFHLLRATGGQVTEHKDLKPGHTHRHADGTVHTHH